MSREESYPGFVPLSVVDIAFQVSELMRAYVETDGGRDVTTLHPLAPFAFEQLCLQGFIAGKYSAQDVSLHGGCLTPAGLKLGITMMRIYLVIRDAP